MFGAIQTNKTLFLCGYFTKLFVDTMYSLSLYPLIDKPTRVTKDTATLIDNIYTNRRTTNGILISDIIDHFPVFTLYDYTCLDIFIKKYDKYSPTRKITIKYVNNKKHDSQLALKMLATKKTFYIEHFSKTNQMKQNTVTKDIKN